jgi:hypothetical protein
MALPSPGGEGQVEGERQNKLFILPSNIPIIPTLASRLATEMICGC